MPVKITIVTPVYNGEKFISVAIESVISQRGNFYIDYIIVDDGSTDSSLEIIKKYHDLVSSEEYRAKCLGITLRYLTGPNQGQSSAYNTAFGMADGQIMAWMNADDYYLPDALEHVAKLYESDPSIDFIYGDCLKIYESGKKSSTEPHPRPDETLESLRTKGNSFDICFFTKKIFDEVGPLDVNLKYCMDLDFWFKVFAVGKVRYLPFTLAAFRQWSGSNTTSKQEKFAVERSMIFKKYGGAIIPPKKIYALRAKMPVLNILQNKTPRLYSHLKKVFYSIIGLIKYRSPNI